MSPKVILSADSSCDLSPALIQQFDVHIVPFSVELDGKNYLDGVDIDPDEIYRVWQEKKELPTTAAVNIDQYLKHFKPFVDQGYEVVHFSLGSSLSSSHQNATVAAQQLGHIYTIDSANLSTGTGLLVLEAADRIAQQKQAAQIQREVQALVPRVRTSFLLDTLEFLYAGGRCSALARLGANALHIKPCIQVQPDQNGAMGIGKLYRGKWEQCLLKYVQDKLSKNDTVLPHRLFITHSGVDQAVLEKVQEQVAQCMAFEHVYVTRAGCTVSSHCGPNTLGVLFLVNE